MAAVTWLGGVGYLLRANVGLTAILVVPLAILSGLIGGLIMFYLLAKVLWPMMAKPLSDRDFELPGTLARVVSSIREGGVGEIVYTKADSRFTAGARAADGRAIPKGAEVVILGYERGIAEVRGVDDLLEEGETDLGEKSVEAG
jgi:membrane protein implicated in regulation of membrane protease activity